MADTRSIRRNIKRLQRVKTWQLIAVLVLLLFMTATFLRLNNIGMIQRRDAVIAADEQGEENNTRNRLIDLQRFVSAHMNTGGNTVYLEYQYERDSQAMIQAATAAGAADNADHDVINKKVDDICKPQFSGYNQGYVECFAREFARFAPGSDPVSEIAVDLPDPERYRFVFASPLWSPDFAGFSVLACIALVVVIIVRLIGLLILKILLKTKYQDV